MDVNDVDRDLRLSEAVKYRKSGGEFLTAEQSLANMREASGKPPRLHTQNYDKNLL